MEIKVQRPLQNALRESPKQTTFRDRSKNVVLNLARTLSSNVSKEASADESVGQGKLYAPPKRGDNQNKQHVISSTDESVGQGKLYAPPKIEKKQQPSEEGQNKQHVESSTDEPVGQGRLYGPPKVAKKQQFGDGAQTSKRVESSVVDSISQGKLYTPPKVRNKEQFEFLKERGPSRSREVSEGEESEEDEKRMEREGGSHAPKSQQINGVQGWGVGKSVLQVSKGVAADLRGSLSQIKDMLIDKLAAVPIPADTLEHARHSMESIVREATQTAYGKTRDAMLRIRVRLVEVIPSLSPNETKKIVDDVEQQVLNLSSANGQQTSSAKDEHQIECGRSGISASTASAVSPDQPHAPSLLSINMDRIRSWPLFRSRL